ncbi:Transcriptional regulator SlyA [Durusdinium trenchii]|uniref:Transcriptional regulator SlyA n=1 Tax=Durusdinium trenchii TaxID=1381693 RepID=A0ABP0QDF5_9DINO
MSGFVTTAKTPVERIVLEYDWENSVGYWICSTAHALRRALTTELAAEGITLRQWEVLAWLSCKGCGSQSELAEHLGIEPHTLAGILSRMERDGLLDRRSCDQDRRRNKIYPTQRAEEIWERAAESCRRIRRQALEGLPAEEIEQLKSTCERIRSSLIGNEEGLGAVSSSLPTSHE